MCLVLPSMIKVLSTSELSANPDDYEEAIDPANNFDTSVNEH